jgi:hypothetical protein
LRSKAKRRSRFSSFPADNNWIINFEEIHLEKKLGEG